MMYIIGATVLIFIGIEIIDIIIKIWTWKGDKKWFIILIKQERQHKKILSVL